MEFEVVDVVAGSVLEFLTRNFNYRSFLEAERVNLDYLMKDRRLANRFWRWFYSRFRQRSLDKALKMLVENGAMAYKGKICI